jgi:biotin operon repressor
MDDAHDETMVTVRIGIMLAAKIPRAQIGRQLDLDSREVEKAIKRLRAVSERIDRSDDFYFEF